MAFSSDSSSITSADSAYASHQPVPASARVFGWGDHVSLWFSLGVGLLVMQMGSYLVPGLGLSQAMLAVVLGSALGAGLLAWVAALGCHYGLSSSALVGRTLGQRFAMLPVGLNVVQLLGWTAFELVVMRDGTAAIIKQLFGVEGTWLLITGTLMWGALLLALARGSMVGLVRRFVSRVGLPLVVCSLLWLSYHFIMRAQAAGWGVLWTKEGDGSLSFIAALDLVVAMPVSWLPLVADYARHGRSTSSTAKGTWLGYTLANIWCYALGVLVVSTSQPGVEMVSMLLLAQGGLLALGLILIDETDNAYGDVHSGAVSLNFLRKGWSIRSAGMALAALATACALGLQMHNLESFLLMLSSIFVPLFGVVITQLSRASNSGDGLPPVQSVRWGAAMLWLLGVAVFHASAKWTPELGSALPSLLVTLVLGFVLRQRLAN